MTALDVDAYFERIRWRGGTTPTYETLAGMLAAHMHAIPFENLDVLLGRPVRLDLDALEDKLVRRHRGGYCFEHATLFAAALEAVGFAPVRHTARVVLFAPRNAAPRTHMFLTVPLPSGTFVVDPGFGGLASAVPVPLRERPAPGNERMHWLVREDRQWVLCARRAGEGVDCWVSTLEADNAVDFEVGNHYTSTHPASSFVNRLMLRATTADGQVSVMNRSVTRLRGHAQQSTELSDRAALRALLIEDFGFDLPEVETMCVPSIPEWP